MNFQGEYACIRCGSAELKDQSGSIVCLLCKGRWLQRSTLKILTHDPKKLVDHHRQMLQQSLLYERQSIQEAKRFGVTKQALKESEARLRNILSVQARFMRDFKIRRRLIRSSQIDQDLPAVAGWSFEQTLPYVYADWGKTRESKLVNRLFSEEIDRNLKKPRGRAAVLGCGAGGLVRDLAPKFQKIYGVDLSLPTLLIARELLRGRHFKFELVFPKTPARSQIIPVNLRGEKRRVPTSRSQLIAADVYSLPFADESMDCITSQFLWDIVSSQKRLAIEINRVLKPGGIWICFGASRARQRSERFNGMHLIEFAKTFGFNHQRSSLHPFNHLDQTELSRFSTFNRQVGLFFSFKKTASISARLDPKNIIRSYFRGESRAALALVPIRLNYPPDHSPLLENMDGNQTIDQIAQNLSFYLKLNQRQRDRFEKEWMTQILHLYDRGSIDLR